MNSYFRFGALIAALLLAGFVGALAYNAGVAHGLAQNGKIVAGPGYAYGWYGPAILPFFFAPFLMVMFIAMLVRALFWRGGHHYRYHHQFHGCCGAPHGHEEGAAPRA
ncbi:MAG TPA: hypothetical protein VFN10_11280 [Thermoanaerobaculia bacterium]|nr:hypothetical protein [Thermoanaerobaculia bacterium]